MLKRAREALSGFADRKRARAAEGLEGEPAAEGPGSGRALLPQFGIELRASPEYAQNSLEGELLGRALFRLAPQDWLPRAGGAPEPDCDVFEAAGLLLGPAAEAQTLPCPLSFQATAQVLAGLMSGQNPRGPRARVWLRVYPWDVLLPCGATERDQPFETLHTMIAYLARPMDAALGAGARVEWGPLGAPVQARLLDPTAAPRLAEPSGVAAAGGCPAGFEEFAGTLAAAQHRETPESLGQQAEQPLDRHESEQDSLPE